MAAPPAVVSLAPDSFNFHELLGEPPTTGSEVHKREIETMLRLQAERTPPEIDRCEMEVDENGIGFARGVLGAGITQDDYPDLAALLNTATQRTRLISNAAKLVWGRKRPYEFDPRIVPCVALEKTPSYPSGHATRGMLWATILSELFPERRDDFIRSGKEFGTDRTLAGVHYPSDVAAGQKLGAEIARRFIANPAFGSLWESARRELARKRPVRATSLMHFGPDFRESAPLPGLYEN